MYIFIYYYRIYIQLSYTGGRAYAKLRWGKIVQKKGKKGNVTTTHGAGKFGGQGVGVSHPNVNF